MELFNKKKKNQATPAPTGHNYERVTGRTVSGPYAHLASDSRVNNRRACLVGKNKKSPTYDKLEPRNKNDLKGGEARSSKGINDKKNSARNNVYPSPNQEGYFGNRIIVQGKNSGPIINKHMR